MVRQLITPVVIASPVLFHVLSWPGRLLHQPWVVCCLALSLLMVSCHRPIDEKPTTGTLQVFNPQSTDAVFDNLKNREKIEFLQSLLSQDFSNPEELDDWFEGSLRSYMSDLKQLTPLQLHSLIFQLHQGHYRKSTINMATAIINSPLPEQYDPAISVAAAALTYEYRVTNQKDSVTKYFGYLEEKVESDTSAWIKIAYHLNKGGLAESAGNYFQAAVSYHNALDLIEPNDKENLSTMYISLANMYINMGYYDKAKSYVDQLSEKISIDLIPKNLRIGLGIVQYRTGKLDEAEVTYNQLLADSVFIRNSPVSVAQVYTNFANLKRKQGDFATAARYLDKSDDLCKKMNVEIGLFINLINRAEIFFAQGDYTRAERELSKGEVYRDAYGSPSTEKEFNFLRHRIHDSLGNENLSNKYYRAYIESKEAFVGDLPRSIIAEWELSRKREQLLESTFKYETAISEQRRDKYLITLFSAILLFIGIYIYLLSTKKAAVKQQKLLQEKQKVEHELEIKSKELMADSVKSISVENTKTHIQEELAKFVKTLSKEDQDKYQKISNKLFSSSKDEFLNEFEMRFKGVYEDFYQKIKTIAPDLTPTELRVCALIRLNMTTKEMATLTHRSVGTIENIRISVRKKFQLDSHANLQQFLMEI